jgi:hypothetical protein
MGDFILFTQPTMMDLTTKIEQIERQNWGFH